MASEFLNRDDIKISDVLNSKRTVHARPSYSGWQNLDPAEFIFLKFILMFRGPRSKRKEKPGAEAASAAACVIGAFIGIHGLKCI